MQTTISVPADIYDRAERAARDRGLTRSQFYATAAARLLEEWESADLTAAINAVVDADD